MKESESQKKATRKYINSKYRPSVYMDMELKAVIENRVAELGFKSPNEYVNALIEHDIKEKACPLKQKEKS